MILYEIEQVFQGERIENLESHIHLEMQKSSRLKLLKKGSRVAVTAGSRGIENIVIILREVCSYLKNIGMKPFIVPAMGSHGGATAEGQVEVLAHLGITEETVGAPILSSMEVVKLGETSDGLPVYMDRYASEADGIIVINRIKVHTAFRGKVESGLSKMVTIGLGKQKGASFVHSEGANSMFHNIYEVCKYALQHSPICMGLAIVENGYDETSIIKGIEIEEWFEEEGKLLEKSKELMPSLPLDEIDVLAIEEMGKCYSGTGMDPNIIGRWRIKGVPEPEKPDIKRIAVLDLAEKSFGNAQGVGLADFTTEKLIGKIDRTATYMNAITSTFLQRVMFPLIFPTEKQAIEAAIKSLGPAFNRDDIRYIQIPNTLHLSKLFVSKKVLEILKEKGSSFIIKREFQLDYTAEEDLAERLTHN